MKKLIVLCFASFWMVNSLSAQKSSTYKKKVLESIEVDFLMGYYEQEGKNASVTGGIGTEKLNDITPTIVIKIPLNEDAILTVDVGISAYSSASSSNLDPFDASGASKGGDDDDDDDDDNDDDDDDDDGGQAGKIQGSPWVQSTGASQSDVWKSISAKYTHFSDDRNTIFGLSASASSEYDYSSIGFGASITKLLYEKNTELGISGQVYLDTWDPKYPTELDSYIEAGKNLNSGFFAGIDILNQQGNIINKSGAIVWAPHSANLISTEGRKTYSVSLSFSQILSKNAQMSLFIDLVKQEGWLANPMQRVYFSDKANYYIGNAESITNYTSSSNTDVFHLADDIERLPTSRLKIPIGARLNYFLNENIVVKTYYRFYSDDWGISAHTASIELPIKFAEGKYTLYPSYRYYRQTASTYFAPYNQHLSTEKYYTSDYDLSEFNSSQYGVGFKYVDIFSSIKILQLGLKSADIRYSSYTRNTGLKANILTLGVKFVVD